MGLVRIVRVGVDFGFVQDPTAIVVVEPFIWVCEDRGTEEVGYRVRYTERLPLGIDSISVCDRIEEIVTSLKERYTKATIEVFVDATGVGQAVKDLLRPRILEKQSLFYPIIITSGQESHRKRGTWYVPKESLIQKIAALLAAKRLQIPKEEEPLIRELEILQIKTTAARRPKFEAPSGEHDDLVIALGMAVWRDPSVDSLRLYPIRRRVGF